MFEENSSATMASVFLVSMYAMYIVHAAMEATKETVVSVHSNSISCLCCCSMLSDTVTP